MDKAMDKEVTVMVMEKRMVLQEMVMVDKEQMMEMVLVLEATAILTVIICLILL